MSNLTDCSYAFDTSSGVGEALINADFAGNIIYGTYVSRMPNTLRRRQIFF